MFLVTCTSAFADGGSVNYSGSVALSGDPGFSFSFSEPGTLTSLTTTTTVDITQGATNLVLNNSTVQYWSSGMGGMFDVDFTYLGSYYDLSLYGPQAYSGVSGPYTLLTGSTPVGGFLYLNNNVLPIDLVIGKVTATSVAAPEPAGLAMLGLGIVALLAFRKKQLGSATA
jgi:PEP-CTERM motif